jgi:hypothetical protein
MSAIEQAGCTKANDFLSGRRSAKPKVVILSADVMAICTYGIYRRALRRDGRMNERVT